MESITTIQPVHSSLIKKAFPALTFVWFGTSAVLALTLAIFLSITFLYPKKVYSSKYSVFSAKPWVIVRTCFKRRRTNSSFRGSF
jgi:hypothetical protein